MILDFDELPDSDDEREHEDVIAHHDERNRMDEENAAAIVARLLGKDVGRGVLLRKADFCHTMAQGFPYGSKSREPWLIAAAALNNAFEERVRAEDRRIQADIQHTEDAA